MRVGLFAAIALLFFASCSDFNKVFKSKDNGLKYNKAIELFEKKDYTRSLQLLEQLRDSYRGSDSLESVYYHTAYCHFHLQDYEYAALFFKDYTENFTRNRKLTECAYMAVYCDFLSIGTYELDQSNTKHVIDELQTFINYYPNSSYALKCNEHIDALRKKLYQKEYEWVKAYLQQGHYRAAVTSARNTLKTYPDIEQKEELEYITIQAQYLYATNSIEKKKLERMKEAMENWKEYNYINSNKGTYYKEALVLKEKIEKELKKLQETI
ncbi:MAG: outer membrane protein assembly factor BamD [Bacteroidia bacterium]|nr:outer membrane protein assembly factor BamD [Bacteroidia bacterium]